MSGQIYLEMATQGRATAAGMQAAADLGFSHGGEAAASEA